MSTASDEAYRGNSSEELQDPLRTPNYFPSHTLQGLYLTRKELDYASELLRRARQDEKVQFFEAAFKKTDVPTLEHSQRLAFLAPILASRIGYTALSDELYDLTVGAYLHDVGKLHPEVNSRLYEAGKPSKENWAHIQQHPRYGVEHERMQDANSVVRGLTGFHHMYKRYDPYGAPLEAVPLGERNIELEMALATVDAYDAIRSARIYSRTIPSATEALQLVRKELVVPPQYMSHLGSIVLGPEISYEPQER